MPRTKEQLEKEYLKIREERMNKLRTTQFGAADYENTFGNIIKTLSKAAYNSVLNEFDWADRLITETNRIHNWIIAGKSLEEISQLPEAQIPEINEHLKELFDAGSVERQYRDETIKMLEDEIPRIQITQIPDNEIEQKLKTYGIPESKSQKTEADKAAERKLFENELHYQIASEFAPSGAGGRVMSLLALNGKKTFQEQFEIYEKAHTDQGQYEIAKTAFEIVLNLDIEKYLNADTKEYAENYAEYHTQSQMLFDGEFIEKYKPQLSEFLTPDDFDHYAKYSKQAQAILNSLKPKNDTKLNNLSQYIDSETLTNEQLAIGTVDPDINFKHFMTALMTSKVDPITPESIQLGTDMQKRLRNSVVMHNPEMIHEVPSLNDNTWNLRKPQDPKAQRPWDKDLGNNVMPVIEDLPQPSVKDNAPEINSQDVSPDMSSKEARANRAKEYKDNFYKDKSDAYRYFLNNSNVISRGLTAVVNDILKKGLSVEAYSDDYAYRIYSDGPKLSYEKFCGKFKIPEKEKLSKEEIQHRKALSASAVKREFARAQAKHEGIDFKRESSYHGFIDRAFAAVMMDPGKENLEKNKAAYNTIKNGTNEEKKKLIEDRFNELIKRSQKYIGKSFTDEQLVENSAEIQQLGLAVGMEWQNIAEGLRTLKEEGVEISQNIINDMKNINKKMYVLNNIYVSRLDYIGSMYYQYGGYSQFTKYTIKTDSEDALDPELFRTAVSVQTNFQNSLVESTDVVNDKLKADNKEIEAVYSLDGKKLGNYLTSFGVDNPTGGEMAVYYKGDPMPHLLKVTNLDTLNPEISFGELTKTQFKRVNAGHFDDRLDMVERQRYTPEREKFETSILEDQYKLAMMIEDEPKGNIADIPGVKDIAASYLAKIAIKKMLEKNKLADEAVKGSISDDAAKINAEIVKDLISDASVKKSIESMKQGDFLDKVLKTMPQNLDGILMQEPDDVYKLITSVAQKEASTSFENKQKANELERQQFAEKSIEKANKISQAYADADVIADYKFWGMDTESYKELGSIAHESLQGLSLDRASAQVIIFAKMIVDGKQIDDILDPNKLNQEKAATTNEVIGMLKNGDAKKIADTLFNGTNAILNYLDDKTKGIEDFSIGNIMSSANKNLLTAVRMLKDFTQEYNVAISEVPEQDRHIKSKETQTKASNYDHAFISIGSTKNMCMPGSKWKSGVDEMMNNALKCSFMSNYLNQQKQIPGNQNKPISELINEDLLIGQSLFLGQVKGTKEYQKFFADVVKSDVLKQKLTECIKDGSFNEIFKPQITVGEDNLPSMEVDFKKALSALSIKPMVNKIEKKAEDKKIEENQAVLQSDEQRRMKKDLVLG